MLAVTGKAAGQGSATSSLHSTSTLVGTEGSSFSAISRPPTFLSGSTAYSQRGISRLSEMSYTSLSSWSPHSPKQTHTLSSASNDTNYPSRTTAGSIPSGECSNPESSVQEAISSNEAVVFVNQTGSVIAGTLEGLVERLVNNISKTSPLQSGGNS